MYLVQIDVVRAERAQAVLDGACRVCGGVVAAGQFRGKKHFVSPARNRLAHDGLAALVAFRRVDECHADFERRFHGGDALLLRHIAESAADRPSAKGYRGNFRSVFTELSLIQLPLTPIDSRIALCTAVGHSPGFPPPLTRRISPASIA